MAVTTRSPAEAQVLQANAGFYRAFSHGDAAAMGELWAARAPVACFHPGSAVLLGREAVLASFREILRERPPFVLRCDRPSVQLLGDAGAGGGAAAIVTCYEGSGQQPAHLAATNVFVLEDGRWRMVLHQAGPLSTAIPRPPPPSIVN